MRQLPEKLKTLMEPLDSNSEFSSDPQSGDLSDEKSDIRLSEAQQLREEKLKTIRQGIEDGSYDSDTVLEKALGKMLESLQEPEDYDNLNSEDPLH